MTLRACAVMYTLIRWAEQCVLQSLGLGWVSGYNGKPALITKSGSVYRGDDYIEICTGEASDFACIHSCALTYAPPSHTGMNTMRFAYLTKKGVNSLLGRIPDFHLHAAIVRAMPPPSSASWHCVYVAVLKRLLDARHRLWKDAKTMSYPNKQSQLFTLRDLIC